MQCTASRLLAAAAGGGGAHTGRWAPRLVLNGVVAVLGDGCSHAAPRILAHAAVPTKEAEGMLGDDGTVCVLTTWQEDQRGSSRGHDMTLKNVGRRGGDGPARRTTAGQLARGMHTMDGWQMDKIHGMAGIGQMVAGRLVVVVVSGGARCRLDSAAPGGLAALLAGRRSLGFGSTHELLALRQCVGDALLARRGATVDFVWAPRQRAAYVFPSPK
jgi:hypothetical protein